MTNEEVLQKVNDYCTEKQYTTATLTDGFKNKFVEHFVKANPEADINDESVLASMKFALNTAFSSASDLATVKNTEFTTKEDDYKKQIAELQKKQVQQTTVEIPKEVKDQLEELKKYKDLQTRQEKVANILSVAKEGIRSDLHASFEKFATGRNIDLRKDDKENAEALRKEFQEIFKDSIGNIQPLTPQQEAKLDDELIESITPIKL